MKVYFTQFIISNLKKHDWALKCACLEIYETKFHPERDVLKLKGFFAVYTKILRL